MINGQTEIKTNYATVITLSFAILCAVIGVIMFTTTIDHWFEKLLAGTSWLGISAVMFVTGKRLVDLERAEIQEKKKAHLIN